MCIVARTYLRACSESPPLNQKGRKHSQKHNRDRGEDVDCFPALLVDDIHGHAKQQRVEACATEACQSMPGTWSDNE